MRAIVTDDGTRRRKGRGGSATKKLRGRGQGVLRRRTGGVGAGGGTVVQYPALQGVKRKENDGVLQAKVENVSLYYFKILF